QLVLRPGSEPPPLPSGGGGGKRETMKTSLLLMALAGSLAAGEFEVASVHLCDSCLDGPSLTLGPQSLRIQNLRFETMLRWAWNVSRVEGAHLGTPDGDRNGLSKH